MDAYYAFLYISTTVVCNKIQVLDILKRNGMSPEIQQVLRGLAHNRLPGFNFPANFLELSFDEMRDGDARLSIQPGPHCVDAHGRMSLAAFGLLADIGLAAPIRSHFGAGARMATVALSLQFTGAPLAGPLAAHGSFDGLLHGASERLGISRVRIHADRVLACTGSGTFITMGGPDATPPLPMRRAADYRDEPLQPAQLTPQERDVLARAESAMKAGGKGSFIERFLGMQPRRTPRGAVVHCPNGLQIGNRVGHMQGGISLALAAATASRALGEEWMISGITAHYVSPGIGKEIEGRSRITHLGQRTAVVHTVLRNDGTSPMLQAVSSHARRAHAA